jgi:hypothetical protein
MITIIICTCVVIGVAIICYTYYRIEELKQCLVSNDIDTVNTLDTISRLIDKYSKSINDKTLNPTGFIGIDSINTFNDTLKTIIDNDEEEEDYEKD